MQVQEQQSGISLSYKAVRNGYSVACGGRVVGHIRLTVGAKFRYFPLGVKSGGELFATLAQCKQSLEAA